MSRFEFAIETVLAHEGGFVDNPHDPGGATNYGVSLRWLKSVGDSDGDGFMDGDLDFDGDGEHFDIRQMQREDAEDFYFQHWWNKHGYASIAAQVVATKVFDLAVNMGAKQAHKCLQRAVHATGVELNDDGIIGPKTLEAINGADQWQLVAALRSEAAGFYRQLPISKPSLKQFLRGWLKRAYS